MQSDVGVSTWWWTPTLFISTTQCCVVSRFMDFRGMETPARPDHLGVIWRYHTGAPVELLKVTWVRRPVETQVTECVKSCAASNSCKRSCRFLSLGSISHPLQNTLLPITPDAIIMFHDHQSNEMATHHYTLSVRRYVFENCCTPAGLDILGEKSHNMELLVTDAAHSFLTPYTVLPFCSLLFHLLYPVDPFVSSLERKKVIFEC